jgi:hypothetical protein
MPAVVSFKSGLGVKTTPGDSVSGAGVSGAGESGGGESGVFESGAFESGAADEALSSSLQLIGIAARSTVTTMDPTNVVLRFRESVMG